MIPAMPATVMLVHGAWHGAWCFERVLEGLATRGVPAVAVDLPGHGADRGPLVDLHGDALRVRERLDAIDGEVVLLGHSYGGVVVTEAGVHPSVRELVYVCAFNLTDTESCARAAEDEPGAATISHEGRPNLADAFVIDDGVITLTRDGARATLYNRCAPATADWALDRLGPQRVETLTQSPTAVAWRDKPSTYVVCGDDMTVHPDLQRLLAARATTSVEWDADHSPYLSCTARLVELLAARALV
jgi:pimeloyl-ACP methyl ester carboxylesterase